MIAVLVATVAPFALGGAKRPEDVSTTAHPFFPEMETLSQEELQPLLEKWDNALEIEDFLERHRALPTVYGFAPRGMRFAGAAFLLYDNPEVKDRIINLYLQEYAKADEPDHERRTKTNPWYGGEAGAEYVSHLTTAAESTFDPRIYETELTGKAFGGRLRTLYLATVNPEQILTYLFESRLGEWIGGPRPGHRDLFYNGSVAWGMSVDRAYTLLSLMTIQSPDVLRKHRGQVLEFVMTHIDHFREPRSVSYKDELVYMRHYDYEVRDGALDVLQLLGTAENVELVEEIIRDVPQMGPERLSEDPRDRRDRLLEKGARVIEQIRQRTPLLPATTTLSEEELQPLLEEWDKIMNSDMYLGEKYNALPSISQEVPRNMRFHGESVLRYDNPEIKDRVVDLYLNSADHAKDAEPGVAWYGPGEGEFFINITTWAESTMDPRIYDKVAHRSALVSQVRLLYLATVNAERTLNYLLESKRGEWIGGPRPGHRDYFYHGAHAWGMSVDGAYTLLSLMTIQSPDVLHKHRERVLAFIETHLKHYASAREVDYKAEPVYLRGHDYKVRDGALDGLQLLGTAENVELVEEIIRDVPEMGPERLSEDPRDRRDRLLEKGARVIERMRRRKAD
jgi:hypothetical protein